jgi:hypothetical protein
MGGVAKAIVKPFIKMPSMPTPPPAPEPAVEPPAYDDTARE